MYSRARTFVASRVVGTRLGMENFPSDRSKINLDASSPASPPRASPCIERASLDRVYSVEDVPGEKHAIDGVYCVAEDLFKREKGVFTYRIALVRAQVVSVAMSTRSVFASGGFIPRASDARWT